MIRSLFRVAQLDAGHDRITFASGSEALDRYFHERVSEDVSRRVAACFVALADEGRIAGFYTLASASPLLDDLPTDLREKLPRYPSVPAVRLGRLAVDQEFQGQGLGGGLLTYALARAARSDIAASALVVDAKDDIAVAFYRRHGFILLEDAPRTLFLPLASVPTTR